MKKFILIGFWASAGLLGLACGDSDDPSSGTGGGAGVSGAAGSAGAPNGGSAGSGTTGGTSGAATGGAAGNAGSAMGGSAGAGGSDGGMGADGGVGAEGGMGEGGETTTGGSAGSGGGGMGGTAGGGSGGGGSGGGPAMGCPMNQPMAMSMCTTRGLSCDFGDTICRCNLNSGNWNCFDQNGDCPAMPDPGGTCTGGQTACSYGGDGTCVCIQGDFTCDDGVVTCPTMAPNDGASCTMFPAGFDCAYPAGDCSCGTGTARTWNCEGGSGTCPAMAPDEGDPCMTPGLICDYATPGPGADETCVCNQNNDWTCI